MACFAVCFGLPKRAPIHDESTVHNNPLQSRLEACSEPVTCRPVNSVCEPRASITSAWVATNLAESASRKAVGVAPAALDPVELAGMQLRTASSTSSSAAANGSELPAAGLSPNTPTIIAPSALRAAANRSMLKQLGAGPALGAHASVSAPVFKIELPAEEADAWVPAPKQLLQPMPPEAALAPLLLVENDAVPNSALELGEFYESMLLSMQIRLKVDAELSTFRAVPSMGSHVQGFVARLSMGQNTVAICASANASGAHLPTSSGMPRADRRFVGSLEWSAPPPGGPQPVPGAALMAALAAAADSQSHGPRGAGRRGSNGFEFVLHPAPQPQLQPQLLSGVGGGASNRHNHHHRGIRRNNSQVLKLDRSRGGPGGGGGGLRPLQAMDLSSGPGGGSPFGEGSPLPSGSTEAPLAAAAAAARRASAASGLSSGPGGDGPGTEAGGEGAAEHSTAAQLVSDERDTKSGGVAGLWQDLDQMPVPLEPAVDVASGATLLPPAPPTRQPGQARARSAIGAEGAALYGDSSPAAPRASWEAGMLDVSPSQDPAAAAGAASQWSWPQQWGGSQSPPQTPPAATPPVPYSLGGAGVVSSADAGGVDDSGSRPCGSARGPGQERTHEPPGDPQPQPDSQQTPNHHNGRGGAQFHLHLHHHHHHHGRMLYSGTTGSSGGRPLRPIPEGAMDASLSNRLTRLNTQTTRELSSTSVTDALMARPGSPIRMPRRYEPPSLKTPPQQQQQQQQQPHVLVPSSHAPKVPTSTSAAAAAAATCGGVAPSERAPAPQLPPHSMLVHLQPSGSSPLSSPFCSGYGQFPPHQAGRGAGPRRAPSASKLAPTARSSSWYGGAPPVHPDPKRVSPEVPVEMRLCHGAAELLEGLSDVRPLEVEDGDGGGVGSAKLGSGNGSVQAAPPPQRPQQRHGGQAGPRVGGWMPESAAAAAAVGQGGGAGARATASTGTGTGCRSVVLQGRWQGHPVGVKLIFGSELDPRNSGFITAVAAAAAVHPGIIRVYGVRLLPPTAVNVLECRKLAAATAAAGDEVAAAVTAAALRPGEGVLAVLMEYCTMGSLDPLTRAVYSPFRPNRSWPAYLARRALLRTALEVAGGLAHLHRYGLAHGALRPCNVLLVPALQDRRKFCAKITDTGLSACVLQVSPAASLPPHHLQLVSTANGSSTAGGRELHFTAAAAALALAPSPAGSASPLPPPVKPLLHSPQPGSGHHQHTPSSAQLPLRPEELLFVAPEALVEPGRLLASPAADVFAFGMLLWALAAGQTGWPPELVLEAGGGKAADGGSGGHRPLPTWPTGSHPQLRDLYEACVATRPEDRPNMEQVVHELEQVDEGLRNERPKTRAAAAAGYAALAAAGAGRSGGGNLPPGFLL